MLGNFVTRLSRSQSLSQKESEMMSLGRVVSKLLLDVVQNIVRSIHVSKFSIKTKLPNSPAFRKQVSRI